MARFKPAYPDEQLNTLGGGEEEINSLHQPQREPLKFNVDTSQLPPHLAELVLEIQRTAETQLFHWKTFPLNPPQPLAVQELSEGTASTRRKPLVVENLFDLPSWDDLDVVSVDNQGEAKRLSNKQLSSVRKQGHSEKKGSWRRLTADQLHSVCQSGTFTVPSANFPGQNHTWRLSPFLQKGSEPTMDTLRRTIAWSVALLRLTAAERISGDVFSLRRSAQSLRSGLRSLLDLAFGMPSLQPRDFEARLHEERSRYLVAELLCAAHSQEEYMAVCRFIRHLVANQQHHHLSSGGTASSGGRMMSDARQLKAPPLPYIFQTPKGQLIDLRLFSREVMDKARPLVNAVLQAHSKMRCSHHHHHSIHPVNEIKTTERKSTEAGCPNPEEDGNDDESEVLQRLWETLTQHPEIEKLDAGIGQLLVDQARAALAMKRAVGRVRERFTADLIQAEIDIRLSHPFLSLVKPWMDKQLRDVTIRLMEEYRWKCHEEAIETCRLKSLDQFAYFLSRDLAFLRDRAPMLSKELLADKQATRSFLWDTWTWNPHHWVVRRHFQGAVDVVPTHLSNTPTSITTPRTGHAGGEHGGGQEQPIYTLERSSRRSTATQWPLWRWTNFLQRAWSWSWNGAYACGYLVPWCSPIGLRALLSAQPFYADLELSQVNGALCPRRSAYTPTLTSRLASLWRHISKSRTEFETQPDTGFVGKGLTRQINRAWNYGVKGVVCSLLLLLLFPALCLLCSLGGLCLAVTAPLWAPLLALLYHLCIILVWDVDNPDPARCPRPLFPLLRVLGLDLLTGGLLQPVACLATALFLCPLLAFLLSLFGIVQWTLIRARDGLVYHLIIRPRSRVPASEGCLVRRIAGPGLDADFYYQIGKEQALAAMEARLEADRLLAYRRQTERLIRRPAEEFRAFVQQVFAPFTGTPWHLASTPVSTTTEKVDKTVDSITASSAVFKSSSSNGNVAAQLERETQALQASLEEKVERRLYELRIPLTPNILKKIRLSPTDLKMVLIRSAMMIRSFYPTEILARLGVSESELWERYNVDEGDWLALAAIFLGEIFNPAILNPLNETDTRVKLEPKETNLSRYTAMFVQAQLDESGAIVKQPFEWPLKSLLPSQQSVVLPDFSCFSPLARDGAHSSPPWKKKRTHPQSSGRPSGVPSWPHWTSASHHGTSRSSSGVDTANRYTSTTNWQCELLVPLPVPHPVIICLLIYNRHRDVGAIPLESEACRLLIRYLEGNGSSTYSGRRSKEAASRPSNAIDPAANPVGAAGAAASRSPASHKPLLGSSGSDLANLSQPSLAGEFSDSQSGDGSGSVSDGGSQASPSHGRDTLVSIAQDGTLSLVGTLMSEHASVVDIDATLDHDNVTPSLEGGTVEVVITPGGGNSSRASVLGTTLARAADTLRAAFLGEKADESQFPNPSSSHPPRKHSTAENFELLPSSDDRLDDDDSRHNQASGLAESRTNSLGAAETRKNSRRFPTYQPATFKSWRMNFPPPLRYDQSNQPASRATSSDSQTTSSTVPCSPRPLGLFELSSGLSQDRGPAFSPAQFSIGRRLMESGASGNVLTASSSHDSLPFAEEDASLVDSPDGGWLDASTRSGTFSAGGRRHPQPPFRAMGQPYCEMQPPARASAAVLASIEDLSLSLDSSLQHTHLDITSKLGTQV